MDVNTIVQMDALDFLRGIPDGVVDCVVTSPPYNIGSQSGGGKMKNSRWMKDFLIGGYSSHDDDMSEIEYQAWVQSVVRECLRVSKGLVWVNHKTRYRDGAAIHPLSFLPFPMWSEVIWNRGSSFVLNSRRFAPSHEYIFGFGRPIYWDDSYNTLFSVWRIPPVNQDDGHPCPFPERLITPLIKASCPPNGIVLDPFMGSGTTALAARNTGRRYVGCDVSADYVEIARRRLSEPYTPSLFPDEPATTEPDAVTVDMFAEWVE